MVSRTRTVFVNGVLLAGLVGLLIAYLVIVSDLPSQIYTTAQWEYLRYNASRRISQLAPTWNLIQSDGLATPTILPVRENHVQATLVARYEEQDGVSVTVYDLDFRGEYRLAHPGPMAATVELLFPFPSNLETLHEVRFLVDGEEPPEAKFNTHGISWSTTLQAGEEHQIAISYRADGANTFAYGLHHDQRTDVDVTVTVLDLRGSQVPRNSLPPTASQVIDNREMFTWKYPGLIADRDIQLTLPTRLSFAQRITRLQDDFRVLAGLAPFLVGLFLASLAGVFHLSRIRIGLEGYLLAGLGMALFYPMLTFLSGVLGVILASALALTVVASMLLVFLRRTAGRATWWRVGLLLIIYLGFFSLGMLTRWRGLLASGGGLLLVGTFMLLYAQRPALPRPEPLAQPEEAPSEPNPTPLLGEATSEPAYLHCLYCGRSLAEGYSFCPGCGHDTSHFAACPDCGHKHFVPKEPETVHCIHCGESLK
jgi:hypothetical protein